MTVDAVILWVDGNDPAHRAKIVSYLEQPDKLQTKGMATRYRQVNEIEYVVRSILKFAPFVNQIYIVTDNQTPHFLAERASIYQEKVKIVDHKVIFRNYEHYLPVFNSNAIETMIHRIPDLAEHYIYFNDDMFLIKPTKINDFFNTEGLPIIRGKEMRFESDKFLKKIGLRLGIKKEKTKGYLGYKRKQDHFAKLMGETKKIAIDHTPFPMKKSMMSDFFLNHQAIFVNNIQFKFRNENNVLIQSIATFATLTENKSLLKKDYQLARIDSQNKPLFWLKIKMNLFEKDAKKIFLNIQSLDLYPAKKLNFVLKWLNNLYTL